MDQFFELMNYKDAQEIKDELIVVSSFTDNKMNYSDFIHSQEFKKEQLEFEKERTWWDLFQKDITENSASFKYLLDGIQIKIENLKEAFTKREVRDVSIDDSVSGKPEFSIHSVPYSSFQLITGSSYSYGNKSGFAKFKTHVQNQIDNYIEQLPNASIKYYYEGLEREDLLNKVDSTKVKYVELQTGNNFDKFGNHLGPEIRVMFTKR